MLRRKVSILIVLIVMVSTMLSASNHALAESAMEGDNVMSSLSDTQRNSIGVLNYIAFLTKEIETQKDNRMYLESAYSSLYNNTYMNAIDAVTLGQVKSLLTALNNFKMITVKRERLEYIYEQNQAKAIKAAVPSSWEVRTILNSKDWHKTLVLVIRMAIDSAASYQASKSAADLAYLQDGWKLDDKESEILHQGHLDSLEYMWEIIHDYELPGDLAINEDDITRFVDWKRNGNLVSRIQFLESNRDVYQAFGEYWLTLAESYYENGNMEKCLEAVQSYETYSTRIFRQDYHYAKVLPMAITAAGEVYDEDHYVAAASRFASRIIANCDQEDWVLRYFAAETYVELASLTSNESYLQQAYDIVLNNINYLSRKQISMNQAYLADLKPVEVPKDATKSKKQEIETYNKGQAEARKVAVPPVSESLVLNCDLLVSLAEQMHISDEEQKKITGILYGHGDVLFLNPWLNHLYSFQQETPVSSNDLEIAFDGKEIKIPARYLTENSEIVVGGLDPSGKMFSIDDWTVKSVERKQKTDLESFVATITSPEASKFKYTEGSTVWVTLTPYGDHHTEDIQIVFSVVSKTDFLVPHLVFQRIE